MQTAPQGRRTKPVLSHNVIKCIDFQPSNPQIFSRTLIIIEAKFIITLDRQYSLESACVSVLCFLESGFSNLKVLNLLKLKHQKKF